MHRLNTKCILRKTQKTITNLSPNVAVECLVAMLRIWRSWIYFSNCIPAILTASFRGIPALLWTNVRRAPQSGQRKLQPYFQFTVHFSRISSSPSTSAISAVHRPLQPYLQFTVYFSRISSSPPTSAVSPVHRLLQPYLQFTVHFSRISSSPSTYHTIWGTERFNYLATTK
jgi:hypothetical protein